MRHLTLILILLAPCLLAGLSWFNNNGYAMDFDGAQGDHVHFTDTALIPTSGDFTVSLWVRTDAEQVGATFEVLSQRNDYLGFGGLQYWDPNGAHFYIGSGANGNIRIGDDWQDTGVPYPMDPQWHNFTVVKSSTNCLLFIDGDIAAFKGASIRNPTQPESWIGKQFSFGLFYQYTEYFSGQIDEIKVWSRALNAEELRDKMHDTLFYTEPDLFTYIQFNESSASILAAHRNADQVIQGNLVGSPTYTNAYSPVGNTYVDHMMIDGAGTHTSANGVSVHVPSIIGAHAIYVHETNEKDNFYNHDGDKNFYIYDYKDYGYSVWEADQLTIETATSISEHFAVYPEHIRLLWTPPTMSNVWLPLATASQVDLANHRATFDLDLDGLWDNAINTRRCLTLSLVKAEVSSISALDPQDEEITSLTPQFSIEIDHEYYSAGDCSISEVSGDAYLYEGDTLIETIALDNSMISGATLTFGCSTVLADGGYYNLRLDHGAILDDQGMEVVGITDGETWNFTAASNPPQAGRCILLNGVDAVVRVWDEPPFDITGDMTVEAWIKVDAFDRDWQTIVSKGSSSWGLQRHANTNSINFAAGDASVNGVTNVNNGQWRHIAAVKDGAELRLYIDGKLDGVGACNALTPVNDYQVQIGANAQAPGRYFNGAIDDLRIWSCARTEDEIRLHMHHPIDSGTTGLLSYWKFDENTGAPVLDSASGHTGDASNCTNFTSTSPLAAGASELALVNGPGDYTLLDNELVHVAQADYPTTVMLSKLHSAPYTVPSFETCYASQYWILTSFGSDSVDVSMQLRLDQQFVPGAAQQYRLCTRDMGSTGDWTYAADASSVTDSMLFTFDNVEATGQMIIGKETRTPMVLAQSPANNAADIALEPVFTLGFDHAVAAHEGDIALYNAQDELVSSIIAGDAAVADNVVTFTFPHTLDLGSSYYVLVDPNAFILNGNPFPGITLPSQWTFTTLGVDCEAGACVELDGVNDYIQFEEALIPASGSFTVSLWANADESQTSYREIISQLGGGGENFYLGRSINGNIRVGDDWVDSGVAYPLYGGWHYFTVVRDAADTHLYIDGFLMASKGSAIINPQGDQFRIGRQYGSHDEYFHGLVDEIKIWDVALSTDEVRRHMHLTADPADAHLQSYIQFNTDASGVIDVMTGATGVGEHSVCDSRIEVGDAEVYSLVIDETGSAAVGSSGVTLDVSEIHGELQAYVTRFEQTPSVQAHDDYVFSAQYWAVHVYSDSAYVADITLKPSEPINEYYERHPDDLRFNYRAVNNRYNFWYWHEAYCANAAANTATLSPYAGNGCYLLSAEIPLTIVSITPPDESIVPDSVVFAVQFNMPVWSPEGYLRIYRLDDNSLFEEISLPDAPLDPEHVVMFIDPQNTLEPGVTYYVTIDPNSILSMDETFFEGVSDPDFWNFTTVSVTSLDAPANFRIAFEGDDVVLSWDPVDNANSYKVMSCQETGGVFVDVTLDGASSTTHTPGRIRWTRPIPTEATQYYKVVASTEAASVPPSPAVQPVRSRTAGARR